MELTTTNTGLTTADKPKGMTLPFRTLPESALNTIVAFIINHLELKLSVNSDKEQNQKNILALLKEVKESMWGLTPEYIIKAFDAYVNGQLSYDNRPLTPISGYLDVILFKKVVNSYKQFNQPKQDIKSIVVAVWEHWKSNKNLECKGTNETFQYLYDNGILPKLDKSTEVKKRYHLIMDGAKGTFYIPLLERRTQMEKDRLTDTPAFRELLKDMQNIKIGEHDGVLPLFRKRVLEGYFKKLKHDLTSII